MNNNSVQMYKKINFYNLYIALVGTSVIYFVDKRYTTFFLLGIILASINLLFNLLSVNFILYKSKKHGVITFLGLFFRLIIVCGIGIMVFDYLNFAIIAYILGYSSQFISLVLYGINIKECEGK